MRTAKRLGMLALGAYFFVAGSLCIAGAAIDAVESRLEKENWDQATSVVDSGVKL